MTLFYLLEGLTPGGNQSNTWKVSTYSTKELCAVRWPKKPTDAEGLKNWIPARKITKSVNCTSNSKTGETTR